MKNIISKIMVILAILLSFTPSLASAMEVKLQPITNFAIDSLSSYPLFEPYYNGSIYADSNNGYKSTGVEYFCKFVNEKGKIFGSDNFYDQTTLSHVQKNLDDENNNIKNIKNGKFKPSLKSLKCLKDSNFAYYKITSVEFSCRTLDDKDNVLENRNYNVVQAINKAEQVDAENEVKANKKADSTKNLPKKRFQCVNIGESYDIFNKEPENKTKKSQQQHEVNFLVVGIILILIVFGVIVGAIRLMCYLFYERR